MRVINKKYLLVILLVGIILTCVIILKPKEKVKLDNVILKQEVNNKTFAMYKEEGNEYVPVEDNKFPEMYVLNLTESKCIDNNGNELNGVLSYENGNVTITSGITTYCYLYFDKTLGAEIFETNDISSHGLKTDKERGAMYRFQGQQSEGINNYICFGTNVKDVCTSDTDHYMYRIIGIEASTGRVKVIKKEALDKAYQWYTDYVTDIKWPNSLIFKAINNEDFLNNTSYIPTDWKEKIADNTWIYGDMLEDELGAKQLGEELYKVEAGQKETKWYVKSTEAYAETEYEEQHGNWTDTIDSKISLMYLHDYSYSIGDEAKCNFYYHSETEYSKCKLGWIHLSNNDTDASHKSELVMTRNGWDMNLKAYYGFYVNEVGYTGTGGARLDDATHIVRPVFYLASVNELVGGTGTITNPFIIS